MKNLLNLFILCLLLNGCNKNIDSSNNSYYFEIYDKDNNVKGYFKRVIFNEAGKRVDTIYRYDKTKKLQNTRLEEISSDDDSKGIKIRDDFNYSISVIDSCYTYKEPSIDSFEICYLGLSNLFIGNSNYDNTYKFSVSELGVDGIAKHQYFDKNFILVREEFEKGFLDYYRIDRVHNKIEGLN